MANKKPYNSSKKPVSKQVKKNNEKGKFIIITAAVVAIAVFLISKPFIGGNSGNINSTEKVSSTTALKNAGDKKSSNTNPSNVVSGIEIKKADITDRASYYDYDAEGIKMEVLALKAQDGSIKTVFNTCQVCYSSGKGYYIQVEEEDGDELVCQNCGNRFSPDKLSIAKNGCNPIPILSPSRLDDGATIKIDKSFLDKNKAYFSNWKK